MADRDSQSPARNGLTTIFSKNRRDKKQRESATNSLRSASSTVGTGTSTDSDSHGIRASLDSITDRVKGPDDDNDETSGLKKLIPKIGTKRRQKKQQQEDEQRELEEAARGRSVADRGTLESEGRPTLTYHDSSESASHLAENLEPDYEKPSTRTAPPPLISHPSHTGYLTTSSPLIQSAIVPVDPSNIEGDPNGASRTSTVSNTSDNLAASEVEPALLKNSLRAPTDGSQRRSPSPARRLKEALRPGRRAQSPNTSPERGAGVEQVQKEPEKITTDSRRGSVASRLGSIFPEKLTQSPQQVSGFSATSSPERPRTAKAPLPINTSAPQTPPPPPPGEPAPMIVNTPPTPTDSDPLHFSPAAQRERGSSDPATNPNVVTSPSGNMISHRRIRSGSSTLGPSKLSNITSAPLTPLHENGSTTPNTSTQGSGFFSSVFSAAQNAATTLGNTISNTSASGGKHKTVLQDIKEPENPEVETLGEKDDTGSQVEEKELAVKTLGMGDLSLSHLGISENSSGANSPTVSKISDETRGRSESTNDDSTIRAGTPANLASDNKENNHTPEAEDVSTIVRPRSFYEPSMGDQTPPNGSVFEGKTGIHRSGSIRSAIGGRRKRGSSAATGMTNGTTIGAMISAAHSSVAHPTAVGVTPQPKITGFAVASKKRNRDYHQLFRSVPDDDYLIEDYSCALQKEILAHGRLYVSEGHLCFSSNIFGWVTTLVMSFDEIVSIEKRSTALLFKNGLEISTLHAKHIFASFTSRDSTYDLIVGIWRIGHPNLRSSLNGVRLDDAGGGDKTEKDDGTVGGQSASESESDDEEGDMYDEDDGTDAMSYEQAGGSIAGSDVGDKVVSRKPSAAVVQNGLDVEKKESTTAGPAADFPGPATHAPTQCTDGVTHYAKILADEVIQAPLGKVYSLMFGPASTVWMANWLTVEQKCLDLTMDGENSKKPLSLDNKVRLYSYIKPLNGSIGPKQTKCVCTETLDALDLEKAVSVTISTQTPDVPSGNVFSTKTKYCLSWAEGNATRLQMNCAIEWTGKSWLKGPIEKGANDGQIKYAKDIITSLEAAVSSKRAAPAAVGKKGKKGKKSRTAPSTSKETEGSSNVKSENADWGLLQPVQPVLGPVVNILGPLMTGNMMYGLLVGLLVASWFGFGTRGGKHDIGWGVNTPERVAAYEEIWRREESELWQWLEDRVGMDRLRDVATGETSIVKDRLKDEKLAAIEVDHAIRVTEERLRVLKDIVGKDKLKKASDRGKSGLPVEPIKGQTKGEL
ncbi:hypothetical protein B0O99DRAFT_607019 [Bisporella sp. PMI_857]|nr:hypothetical protein B0O99DRAFT_607019 [Bisporella sp. PMI_857]